MKCVYYVINKSIVVRKTFVNFTSRSQGISISLSLLEKSQSNNNFNYYYFIINFKEADTRYNNAKAFKIPKKVP